MENYKVIIGIFASVISIIGYIPYFFDIFKNKTKPHVFSWLMWSLGAGIVFAAQIVKGAGPGAWAMGVATVVSVSITVLAAFKGEKKITVSDWIAFGGSLLGLVAWILTSNPLLAVVLITISDSLAFVPTFRKTYYKPFEETLFTWIIASVKFIFVLIALDTYNATTLLFPVYLILSNSSFTIMMLVRRRIVGKTKV